MELSGELSQQVSYKTPIKLQRSKKILINHKKTCNCPDNHINCLSAKEWLKCQLGVWQFHYEKRDIRDKKLHPATFPIALARKFTELFTHEGELIIDPFVGSGSTLVAASDCKRNAVGFDLLPKYVELSSDRIRQEVVDNASRQIAVCDDARNISDYLDEGSVSLIITSPPYANLLNRSRLNKSRRGKDRKNEQYLKIEQYSQDERDIGTLFQEDYQEAIGEIFEGLLPLLKRHAHCVINIPDMWWKNQRITLHLLIIEALRSKGFELRNTIIWDRTNIVNRVGIFGWPSNYITMGVTFEYLLDFWRP